MTRQLSRRIAVLVVAVGAAFLSACTSPTAPSGGDETSLSGVYGGSGTKACSGVYGGSGTC
jgi:hypothetical protein